jgi:hypothetical protein
MKEWYSTIYNAFIYASMVAFIIGFSTSSKTSLGAYIAGYCVLILGILMLLTIMFSTIFKNNPNISMVQTIYYIMINTGPFILILGVISFILYLLINYKDSIIKGNVAPGFNSFNNIIVMLLLIQMYIINTNVNKEKFEITKKLPKVTTSIIYLIGILTSICSIILYTILKYYSTDGFQTFDQLPSLKNLLK